MGRDGPRHRLPAHTDDGTRPLFRSFLPGTSPSRTFPRLSDVLNDVATFGESLPTTTRAPVSCANVKISLSTDGGNTFPIVLAASTANDGSDSVTVPGTATATVRVTVEAVGNVFFDVSNANFTISASDLIFEDGFE